MQVVRIRMEYDVSDAALGFYIKELFNSGKVAQVVIADEREQQRERNEGGKYVPN